MFVLKPLWVLCEKWIMQNRRSLIFSALAKSDLLVFVAAADFRTTSFFVRGVVKIEIAIFFGGDILHHHIKPKSLRQLIKSRLHALDNAGDDLNNASSAYQLTGLAYQLAI